MPNIQVLEWKIVKVKRKRTEERESRSVSTIYNITKTVKAVTIHGILELKTNFISLDGYNFLMLQLLMSIHNNTVENKNTTACEHPALLYEVHIPPTTI